MRGGARKPLASQKGHLNVVMMKNRQAEEASVKTPADAIMKPPRWLRNKVARDEWKRVLPILLTVDIIGDLDLSNVAGYCNAFAKWVKATEELENMPLVYVDKADGKTKSNPYVDVQIKYAQEMRRFGDACGMSISSRLKAAATKRKTQEEQIESEFGAI
jgi:P27 family predicted phage terminase small subunit